MRDAKRKRVRKPSALYTIDGSLIAEILYVDNRSEDYPDEWYAEVQHEGYGAHSSRRLSAWLLKAADYCDYMNKKAKS